MPYITQDLREVLDPSIQTLIDTVQLAVQTAGKENVGGIMNYVITKLLDGTRPQRYSDFDRIIATLECCKLEYYRRKVAPYEDVKIRENGDV